MGALEEETEAIARRVCAEMIERAKLAPVLAGAGLANASARARDARPGLVDIRRACEFLQVSETKLRGMCRAGSIPFHKVDGSYRFDLDELHEATKMNPRLKPAS